MFLLILTTCSSAFIHHSAFITHHFSFFIHLSLALCNATMWRSMVVKVDRWGDYHCSSLEFFFDLTKDQPQIYRAVFPYLLSRPTMDMMRK